MRNVLIVFVFLFFITGANAQVFYNDTRSDVEFNTRRERENKERIRNNHIRSVRTFSYKADTTSSTGEGFLSSEMNYDDQGNLTEYRIYRKNGRIRYHYAYQWDDSGRCLEFKQLRSDGSNKYREVSVFDAQGNQTDARTYGRTSLFSKKEKLWYHNTARFDDKQNMLEQAFYLDVNDKKLFDRYVYSYYEDGSKKQTIQYNKRGKARHIWNYDCNPAGVAEDKNFKDTSQICIRYETDKDGNKIKVRDENVKYGKVVRIIHKYDTRDNVLEEISYDKKGGARFHSVSAYDEKNNLTRHTSYRRYSSRVSKMQEYRYDPAGNMVEVISYKESPVANRITKFTYGN